jgi:hypothetical protein
MKRKDGCCAVLICYPRNPTKMSKRSHSFVSGPDGTIHETNNKRKDLHYLWEQLSPSHPNKAHGKRDVIHTSMYCYSLKYTEMVPAIIAFNKTLKVIFLSEFLCS